MSAPDARRYRGYADLSRSQRRGRDYEIHVRRVPGARLAVIAPHGGAIENGTSEIARLIAGDDHHLYLFEGIRPAGNYRALHLTSHRFDEPECLALIAACEQVIAVHGCDGVEPQVLVGGRDLALKHRITDALRAADLHVLAVGHRFPALHPGNVANRGARGQGVQLEFTNPLRRSPGIEWVATAVRDALAGSDGGVAR
jgi:phage replication-related protein YjqB (UPF0714/DUF867 family)